MIPDKSRSTLSELDRWEGEGGGPPRLAARPRISWRRRLRASVGRLWRSRGIGGRRPAAPECGGTRVASS
jgi:hypothetical protein